MQSSTKLPSPEAADPKEVALALEEAIALFATGKKEESIKALSRAADAADAAGAPARAVVIRAALVELPGGGPSPAARAASGRPPPPSATRGASVAPRPPSAMASHAPPPPSARAAAEAARTSSMAPAPAAPSSPPGAATSPPRAESHPAPPPATTVDAAAALVAANGASALHVWVRASARDPSLLLVRLLPAGHPAPPGAYEAFLRPAREDENFFAPKH
jgi:hypothetical protein